MQFPESWLREFCNPPLTTTQLADLLTMAGMEVEEVRPALPLVDKLGRVFTALAGGVATSIEVEVRGELAAHDVSVLQLAALKGAFANVVEEQVTFVNAPTLAAERGVAVSLSRTAESPDHRSEITVRGVLPSGDLVSVSGTLSGPRMVEKLTDVEGFDVDLVPADHLLFLRYGDRPGVVGAVGAALGQAQVNIAGAQVSRTSQGGDALMALTVDSAVPAHVLDEIATAIGAQSVRAVDLV